MTITMPAAVPAASGPAPSGDCPCGPIGLVIFSIAGGAASQVLGTEVGMGASGLLHVIVAGKMPDASYAEFVDVSWAPESGADQPVAFMPDAGYDIGIPLYVGVIETAGVGSGPGVLKFKVRVTCGNGQELTTPEYTVTVS